MSPCNTIWHLVGLKHTLPSLSSFSWLVFVLIHIHKNTKALRVIWANIRPSWKRKTFWVLFKGLPLGHRGALLISAIPQSSYLRKQHLFDLGMEAKEPLLYHLALSKMETINVRSRFVSVLEALEKLTPALSLYISISASVPMSEIHLVIQSKSCIRPSFRWHANSCFDQLYFKIIWFINFFWQSREDVKIWDGALTASSIFYSWDHLASEMVRVIDIN